MSARRLQHATWARHGPVTKPGRYGRLLNDLPTPLPALCAAIRGLIIHYQSPDLPAGTPAQRFNELRLRRVPAMLGRLHSLDPSPLREARPPGRRLIGCCRDFAVLLCATLRGRRIPARVRAGFADYVDPNNWTDHWLTEWWDSRRRRWARVDAEWSAVGSFDPFDVPAERFVIAGDAWLAWRSGRVAAEAYGYDADARGAWVIRANLLHDLACLSKIETTPWDFWGLGIRPFERLGGAELEVLDRAAKAASTCGSMSDLKSLGPRLRVPRIVVSYSLDDKRGRARLW